MATGAIQGGGPFESFIRIVTQQNVTLQMEPGFTTTSSKRSMACSCRSCRGDQLVADFGQFSTVNYLAHGFDIPPDVVLVQLFTGLGYLAAVFAIGYFFLRTREVAR